VTSKPKEVLIEGDGRDLFVAVDGVKIAKRSHPGTQHAKMWVSLETGWSVLDCQGEDAIEISYEGVRVHLGASASAGRRS
jgi:hypothetical protein